MVFINDTLKARWARHVKLSPRAALLCRKNEQALVEQKNRSVVRRLFCCWRVKHRDASRELACLYATAAVLQSKSHGNRDTR
jgi:hypothetical protein